MLHSRWACHPICDPSQIIATWVSYCFVNPLCPQNCFYLQSDLSCLYKLNDNIFNHHERLYFSLHRPAPAIRHFFWLVVLAQWWRQAAEPALWLHNDFSIPRAPENMSHETIITIYFHIWTSCNPIIGIFRACRGISIKRLIFGRQRRHRHLISPTRHGCTTHSEIRYLQV